MDVITNIASKTISYPEGTYGVCATYRITDPPQSFAWTAPFDGTYRVIVIAPGGSGEQANSRQLGGGGGGSGGWCEKTAKMTKGDTITISYKPVFISLDSLVDTLTAILPDNITLKATSGSSAKGGVTGRGGAGGTASGGDTNHNGTDGEDTSISTTLNRYMGGNGAPVADWEQLPQYLSGAYGLGGYAEGNTDNMNGTSPSAPELFCLDLGAGGGGGGPVIGNIPGEGSPGMVIIEYALGEWG